MNAEWISCKKQMPKDGQSVLTKTKSGVIREGVWVDDEYVRGWMLSGGGLASRKNPGDPAYWQPYTPPAGDF